MTALLATANLINGAESHDVTRLTEHAIHNCDGKFEGTFGFADFMGFRKVETDMDNAR